MKKQSLYCQQKEHSVVKSRGLYLYRKCFLPSLNFCNNMTVIVNPTLSTAKNLLILYHRNTRHCGRGLKTAMLALRPARNSHTDKYACWINYCYILVNLEIYILILITGILIFFKSNFSPAKNGFRNVRNRFKNKNQSCVHILLPVPVPTYWQIHNNWISF